MELRHYWPIVITAFVSVSLGQEAEGCEHGEIHLQNGGNEFEGRVEVCDSGQWKTVCNHDWGQEEAAVVCRQLGRFTGSSFDSTMAVPVRNSSVSGRGSGAIPMVSWKCSGNETNLLQCHRTTMMCNHQRDARVYCYDNCTEEDIRLVGGSNGESGRVEVCLHRYWGTVCDNDWDSNDATTVCRQLGYSDITGIPTRGAYFGEGSGSIHLSRVQCTSNDTRLTKCTIENSGTDHNNCQHSEDAGVICKGTSSCGDGNVRLAGGENEREGRVEICYNGVWGTVCDYGWDEVDASVVCMQLGHGQPATQLNNLGPGEGPILLSNVNCNQNHSQLSQCVHPLSIDIHNCHQNSTAGVTCLGGTYSSITDITSRTSSAFTTAVTHTNYQQSALLSAVLGVVGGLLVLGAGIAIAIAFVVIMWRKGRIKTGSMDNPTYDEAIRIDRLETITNDNTTHQRTGTNPQNPPYSEIGPKLETNTLQYQGLVQNTMAGEALYESIRNSYVLNAHTKDEEDGKVDEEMVERLYASEAVYDVPPMDDDYDDICYSIQGPTESSYSNV